jgi:hypothetical protein
MRVVRRELIIVAALVLAWGRAAAARPPKIEKAVPKTVLVLRLEGGGLPDDLVQKLDAATRDQTKATWKGVKLLPPPVLEFEAMRVAAGCADDGPACLANLGATLGATDVVRVTITGNVPKKARLTVAHVRVKDQHMRPPHRIEIDDIDQNAIDEFRFHVALALGDKKVAPPLGSIALQVPPEIGGPDGLEIFLDDRKSPPSALKSLPPGDHRVELHKEGFDTFVASAFVRPGRETVVSVSFERQKPAEAVTTEREDTHPTESRADPDPKTNVPTLVAPVQKETATQIEAPVEPPREEKPHLRYTWWLGGATIVATVVATTAWLFILHEESVINNICANPDVVSPACTHLAAMKPCESGDDPVCARGNTASVVTFIAWPIAGILAVATAVAVYFEALSVPSTPEPDGLGPRSASRAFDLAPTAGSAVFRF